MTPHQALQHYKTQTNLARALGAAQSTVSEWFEKGAIPECRQYQIQIATRGRLQADKPALRTKKAA